MSGVSQTSQNRAVKRYGMRLIAFLIIGFVALALSTAQGHYTTLSLGLLLIAFAGATWNTALGARAMYLVPPDQRTRGHVEDRNC